MGRNGPLIEPYYYKNHLGRRPKGIETMLRMYLLANWFNLSDEAVEDAIYDSYAMRKFMGIDFVEGSVPDATTLCKFRKLMNENGLGEKYFAACKEFLAQRTPRASGTRRCTRPRRGTSGTSARSCTRG